MELKKAGALLHAPTKHLRQSSQARHDTRQAALEHRLHSGVSRFAKWRMEAKREPSTYKRGRGRTGAAIMREASTAKRRAVFSEGSLPRSARKTNATAEACTKERHSYKALREQFARDGFNYRRIAREGDVALYEQRWTGCPDAAVCFEVIRVRQREGFQIGGRFIEGAEVYPNSESWGVDGFTFTDWNKAWDKFFEISLEEPALRGRR